MNLSGEIAALGTALAFAVSSVFHTLAGRRVGAGNVNRGRLLLAVIYLVLLHFLLDLPFPPQADKVNIFWLGLSGAIGLALGDAFLFQSFILIGARMAMLLMALAPVFSTVLGWIFFSEKLDIWSMTGIILAIGGVMIVVKEGGNQHHSSQVETRKYLQGILLGLGAAICQALGLVTARPGLSGEIPAISATLIRMTVAALLIWGGALLRGQVLQTFHKTDRRSWGYLAVGALVGPTLGVALSMVAVQSTEVAIASTLIALTPIFLLPIGYFFFKEKFGWNAILGTILALAGVSLLFIV